MQAKHLGLRKKLAEKNIKHTQNIRIQEKIKNTTTINSYKLEKEN